MAKYIDADKLKEDIQANLAAISFNDDYQKGYEACGMSVLKSIDSLQQEQKEQPTRGYDEAYLNEKIAKATKSWKGVDVDKFMDEVRGREPEMDLEKEIRSVWEKCNPVDEGMGVESAYMHIEAFDIIARHFAEWGAERQKKKDDEEQAELFTIVALDAAQRAKEQMMKDAVEGEIVDSGFDDGTAILKAIVPDRRYDSGDKVKVVVIKED